MKFQNFAKLSLLGSLAFFSCDSDDDSSSTDPGSETPSSYVFTDEAGDSTVSFNGQSTRLRQGQEMLDLFETYETTEATLNEMYAGVDGVSSGFAEEALNGASRLLRAKTADSDDYFDANLEEANVIRQVFDGYISSQVETFLGVFTSVDDVETATAGVAGKLESTNTEGATTTRIINEVGLEYKQAFNKGLIGALMLDQIVNNYLSRALNEGNQTDNTNDVLDGDNNYTSLEHFWDEAYGYVYGNVEDDSFLFNYIGRVDGDPDFAGIADDIEKAFITGRAAIVSNDYDVVETQVETLRQLLSEVIAIRAVYYLQQGKESFADADRESNASAFHQLSEGYGFVYSLRFTRDSSTNAPYFSPETVNGYIDMLEAGNGFWDLAEDSAPIDTISNAIAAEFDFTVEEAASTE